MDRNAGVFGAPSADASIICRVPNATEAAVTPRAVIRGKGHAKVRPSEVDGFERHTVLPREGVLHRTRNAGGHSPRGGVADLKNHPAERRADTGVLEVEERLLCAKPQQHYAVVQGQRERPGFTAYLPPEHQRVANNNG